jgi:hypothetical protein
MRVLGAEHPKTLTSANNLASSLLNQGKDADDERILREVLEVQKRVLEAEHLHTLTTANNLAASLSGQRKYVEVEQMLVASLQRVLGPAHPDTLQNASSLEDVRALIRATPPTKAAAPAAADAAQLLPAGTHVLVHRLVAKPERVRGADESPHVFQAACVLQGVGVGRSEYALERCNQSTTASVRACCCSTRAPAAMTWALDDGRELSLKAKCVARAGCVAAGCALEETSSLGSRCQAVKYYSCACQRTDWKAHKPVCTAAQP